MMESDSPGTKWAENHTNWAEEYKQELKEFDEENK